MKSVDIIIPIYNDYEFTKDCINSVLEYTDLVNNNLLLINDKSSDEKILPMLKKFAAQNKQKNIILLHNEKNLGFVKTVNKGMKYSKNDVVLLNSDTEVTKNWLNKIIDCAYKNEYIATVTPLTNNGNIASVPDFCAYNELPKNMSLEEYADLIEKCSLKKYPEITTANAFCMFIKRDVIEENGFFDDLTFNDIEVATIDFSYKALNHGYIHSLCDDTFVYHKETQRLEKENMTSDSVLFVEEYMKKLRKKHCIYVDKIEEYIRKNPEKIIQENIKINTELFGKKRILFLVNEWDEAMNMTAGTSLHLKDIITGIREKIACFVLCPDKEDLSIMNVYLYTENIKKLILSVKTKIDMYGQVSYHEKTYCEFLEKLFEIFKFDIVHVHHFLFQTFDVVDVAKKNNAELYISLHDLYMLCPSVNMVYDGKYCEKINTENCKKCFQKRFAIDEDILENWRKKCHQILKKFDKIFVPSNSTKQIFEGIYKNIKIEVIEHGLEIYKITELKNKTEKDTFDIAFVGVMDQQKGSEVLKGIIKNNTNPKIKVHLFGKSIDSELEISTKNYNFHGKYSREDLPKKLIDNQIDLVCIFSICPETYSYTLTETYMAEIPVLAYDIGAVGERIKNDGLGWTLNTNLSLNDILAKINEIIKDKNEYEKIKNNFKNYEIKTVEEMQKEYKEIYEKNSNINNKIIDFNRLKIITSDIDFLHKNIDFLQKRLNECEIDNNKKTEYITILEEIQIDNKKKEEYIAVLENTKQQKDKECIDLNNALRQNTEIVNHLNEIIKVKEHQITLYENMKIVKLIRKLRGRK